MRKRNSAVGVFIFLTLKLVTTLDQKCILWPTSFLMCLYGPEGTAVISQSPTQVVL